jgi:TonB-linked SusC/RagA family outer membrane protein
MKNMKQKWHVFLLLLLLSATGAFAQTVTVKGVVKGSDDGQPLPGVIVKIDGTTTGVVTDVNGAYKIDAPSATSKLVFSYVGMATQTVVAGNGEVNLSMKSGVEMKEVIVTALGVTRETKALGYTVSTVSGDAVRESGETNVIEALAAKAPGVQVTGSGGTPGASSKILIRGNNTLTGDNTPLIIVDGVPIDNSVNNVSGGDNPYNQNIQGVNESNRALDINPDDIETVTILKGAAAAALYGSKASNGAIIYTTKRGKAGKGLSVVYSGSIGMDKVDKLPPLQTRWSQGNGGGYNTETYGPGPSYSPLTGGTGFSWGPLASSLNLPTYNNTGNFFKTGVVANNNLSISAGDEKSSVRLSIGNTNQSGIIPNSKLTRTTARLTADHKANDWFDLGGSVAYTNTQTEKPQNGNNFSGMLALYRTPVTFDASNYLLPNGQQRQYFAAYDNPFFSAYDNPFTDETNRMMGSFFFNIKPCKDFVITARTGVDMYHTNNQQIYAISSVGNDFGDGTGQVNRAGIDNRNLYQDLIGKYNKQINENFHISALLGYNFQYEQSSSVFTRGRGLILPNIYNFSNASSLYTSNSEAYMHSSAVYADVSVDYKRFLYLDVTGRSEWNSSFGPSGSATFYPKADLSWVFSENMKLPKWFSFGKVRASYASVGKAPFPYSNKTYFSVPLIADGWTTGYGFPYNGQVGYTLSPTYNNPTLKPERTNELEAGTDLRFLDSRVTLDLTVYSRKTTDVLLNQPVPASTGYSSYFTNAAEIDNHGMEIALGLVPVKTKNFSWTITTSWSKNVSNISLLANGISKYEIETALGDPGAYAIVGQPYGTFYGSVWQRNSAGQILIDQNGLPMKAQSSAIIGNPNPNWIAGITNMFKYKNISFSFLWDIRNGGQIWNGTSQSLNYRGMSLASDARDGANATYVIPGVYAAGLTGLKDGAVNSTKVAAIDYWKFYQGQLGASEMAIENGGWIRLRSVNVNYHIPISTAEKKRWLQFVDVGLSARNLLLFTKYSGGDPETSMTGAGSNINGFDFFNNPSTKSYTLNFKVGF